MRKCKRCGCDIPQFHHFCDECKRIKAIEHSKKHYEKNKANRAVLEAKRIKSRKINVSEMELHAMLDPVILSAWQRGDEFERARIAALNPGMRFGEING